MSSLSNFNFDIDSLQEYDHSTGGLLEKEGVMMGGDVRSGQFGDPSRYVDDTPMFTCDQVQYNPKGVHSMLVCSNRIIIATVYSKIIRLELDNPEVVEEIEFTTRPDEAIHRIFLDPTGNHLIISMVNETVYYIHSSWKKPKKQTWRGVTLIESIAWGKQEQMQMQNVTSTQMSILIGTNRGKIWETTISSQEKGLFDFVGAKEPLVKMLYATDDNIPITGMRLEYAGGRYFAIVTTPSRIYQLAGGQTLEQLFAPDHIRFDEIPSSMGRSQLTFYSPSSMLPKSFAWMIDTGVYHGDIIFGNAGGGDKFTTSIAIQDYTRRDHRGQAIPPISIALTAFHFLFLYEDCLQAVGRLSGTIVYEYPFNAKQTRLRGMCVDHAKNTIWIFGESIIFELLIANEDRHAWRLYLDRGQYEQALEYAREPFAAEKRDQIYSTQAERYFDDKKFELAAKFYGMTKRIFEEITLKFIAAGQREALKTYLTEKLGGIREADTTQRTIICTWLTEIYISKLNSLRTVGMGGGMGRSDDAYLKVQADFRLFLTTYKKNLNHATTFHIISSHGAIDELLFFARLIEDYERVISYHIQHQQYEIALKVLTQLTDHKDLYYKFCPVLFHFIPYQTVNAWIKAKDLNPRKLIPSLMRYDHSKIPIGETQNQAIRYLQYCVENRNQDKAVHNYLLSLFVKQKDDEPLLLFLQSDDVFYDLKYALRLCMKERKLKACVLIYSALGLYEEAVDLSLEVDIKLAKDNADKVKIEDEAMCKKLWLRIARHVVEKDNNIKEAMEFLQQCPLLKIEDILPFFPDFTVIDDFKEEICKSLEDYNQYIDELKNEMDDATNSADLIRKDIQDLRNKYGLIKGDQKCDICNYPVLTKRFYLFTCQHVFHSDCLISEIMKYLDNSTKQRVRDLQMSVGTPSSPTTANLNINMNSSMAATNDDTVNAEDSIKSELDRIVARECIYCGDMMIRSIEKPFIGEDELDLLMSWDISENNNYHIHHTHHHNHGNGHHHL